MKLRNRSDYKEARAWSDTYRTLAQVDMKTKNSGILIVLAFIVVASSCRTARISGLNSDNDNVQLKISQVDSTANLLLRITNENSDTVIFPFRYVQKSLTVSGIGIVQKRSVAVKLALPQSNFEELKKTDKIKVINNHCRPYSLDEGFWIMGPGQANEITISLLDIGYEGFSSDHEFSVTCNLFASAALKEYCPSIWTGTLQDSSVLKLGKLFP